MNIDVARVTTHADLEAFVRLPFRLYRADPNWPPPLLRQQRALLDTRHNPFFARADVALFLARQDGEVAGSIAAFVDHRHNQVHDERTGHFGFFESVDDAAVATRLLATAQDWVAAQGMTTLRGPLNFTREQGEGFLIAGADHMPSILTPYNPPAYAAVCERFGLHKVMDAFAYRLDLTRLPVANAAEDTLVQLAQRSAHASRVTLRRAARTTLRRDFVRARPVLDQTYARNWGYTPFTDDEMMRTADRLGAIADPDLAVAAEVDGEIVGLALAIPDYNQILRHLHGRLLPVGWLKALWLRRTGAIDRARFLVIGVLDRYRQQGVEARMLVMLIETLLRKGYRTLEFANVLESNTPINALLRFWGQPYGVHICRTYRIYEGAIQPSGNAACG